MCKPTNVLKCFEFVCGYYVQYDRREMMGVAGMTKHCDCFGSLYTLVVISYNKIAWCVDTMYSMIDER